MREPGSPPPVGAPSLEVELGVATLWLNRAPHHNRLEPADIAVLDGLLDDVALDPAVRALVVRASGRSFCAGYDLADLGKPMPPDVETAGIGLLAEVIDKVEQCRVPSICALNGSVFGGGTDLALACDFRLGITGIRMMMPAAAFGLHYYHSGLRRYVTRLGLGAAKRLFLLGEPIGAEEMLRVGFLDELLPDLASLEARTAELTAILVAAASPEVVASMKRVLNAIAGGEMDPAQADEAWRATRRSPEVARAVAAARRK